MQKRTACIYEKYQTFHFQQILNRTSIKQAVRGISNCSAFNIRDAKKNFYWQPVLSPEKKSITNSNLFCLISSSKCTQLNKVEFNIKISHSTLLHC